MKATHITKECNTSQHHNSQEPLHFLDGIRGFMALNVVLCHFVVVYYPQMYFLDRAQSIGGVLSLFALTPLSILINGDIAVRYFFVLTGFLVGRSAFLKDIQPQQILSRCANRYKRLFPIVTIVTVFTFLTMVFHLQKHNDIATLALNGEFLTYYCNFEPSIFNLLINVFLYPYIRTSAYVGPFWTIRYEFWGYILTLIVCHLLKENKFRKLWYIVVAVLCLSQLSSHYVPFVLGALVADFLYNQNPDYFEVYYKKWIHHKFFVALCMVAGLYFASCPMNFTTLHSFLGYIPKVSTDLIRSFGVALSLYAMLHLLKIQNFFASKLFLFFGNLSFEVYALHWSLMLTLQSWLFSKFMRIFSYHSAALCAFFITLPVIYISAYVLHILLKPKL